MFKSMLTGVSFMAIGVTALRSQNLSAREILKAVLPIGVVGAAGSAAFVSYHPTYFKTHPPKLNLFEQKSSDDYNVGLDHFKWTNNNLTNSTFIKSNNKEHIDCLKQCAKSFEIIKQKNSDDYAIKLDNFKWTNSDLTYNTFIKSSNKEHIECLKQCVKSFEEKKQ
jgi:hypothetical protein